MNIKASRTQKLPAFKLDLAQAEALQNELRSSFDNKVRSRFTVTLNSEEYNFDTVEEIRAFENKLPDVVHTFSLWLSSSELADDTSLLLSTVGFSRRPYVSVNGPNYGWCVAVVAICEKLIRQRRRWYFWLRSWHFWLLAIVVGGFVPTPLRGSVATAWNNHPLGVSGLLLVVASMWTLFFAFDRIFPPQSLVIRDREPWLKRHAPEVTIILTLAGLLATILGLLLR